jgi:4-hydroxy-2-oxoheptanedioate aldolase
MSEAWLNASIPLLCNLAKKRSKKIAYLLRYSNNLMEEKMGMLDKRSKTFTAIASLSAALFLMTANVEAQERRRHINPVIEKLASGAPFIGVSTGNLSVAHARELTRSGLDYVYVDMEHNPVDFTSLKHFTLGTLDPAAIAKRGENIKADLAVFARFPPYGRERVEWIAKQALDIGLMGVIFNSIDDADQARAAVGSMRYPQMSDSKYPEPAGIRGWSPGSASWLWGLSNNEYRAAADVWPLNPDGELLAIMMIESAAGVRNVEEILKVPGVGALFIGPADLAFSMGVPNGAPQVEEALQKILKACLAADVPCGMSINANQMADRIKEGWRMLNLGGANGGLNAGNAAALNAAKKANSGN